MILPKIINRTPITPNVTKLSEKVGLTRNAEIEALDLLERVELIQMLYKKTRSISVLNKPDKIWLHNTIHIYAADDLEWYEMPDLVCYEAEGINFDDSDASAYADCFEDLYDADWIENLEDGGDFDFFDLIDDISDCINEQEDDDWP